MSVVEREVAAPARPPSQPAGAPTPQVGRSIARVDGALKVMGRARFAAEVPFDDLTYGAIACSTIARGRITSIDTSAAEAADGVLLVMTYRNAPRLPAPPMAMADPNGASVSTLPVMQDPEIHWNGQPVAVVVARTQDQAEHAVTLVRVEYAVAHADLDFELAKAKAHPPEDVNGEPPEVKIGDAESALERAAYRVDNVYRTPRHHHAAIEPHVVTVHWESDGGLTVHDTSQLIHATRGTFAKVFQLPPERVRVLSPFVGGGFGGKLVWTHHILAAAAARIVGKPLRMALSRETVFRLTGGRTLTEQRVALGAHLDTTLSALIHAGVAGMTTHNNCPEQFTFPAKHLYASDSFLLVQKIVELDTVANTFMRAPGESIGTFALESAIDELALEMDLDPIELRRRLEPKADPTTGKAFSERSLVEAYRRGAERFGWERRKPKPRTNRAGDWWIGHGVATATYPYYRMPGGSARIVLKRDGIEVHAVVQMGSHEMGMGTATAQAQTAADRLGLPLEHVRFEYGDSNLPHGTVAGGSSQSATITAAMFAAADKLAEMLLDLARGGPLEGLTAADVEFHGGGLRAKREPERHVGFASLLRASGRDEVSVEAAASEPAEVEKYSMHSYGAQFCEVRVNALTGETRVARWLGSFDTGRILNPRTAASQFRGGIIMGLGLALTEEVLFDVRSGRVMNPSLAEYLVPVHLDVPEIDVIWNDIPDPHSPLGLHGIGEIGITGVAAAVANAVYNATGVRVRDLPITLDKLLVP